MRATWVAATLLVCLGVAAIVRTFMLGVGGGLGLLLGGALVAAGVARLYLARRAA